MTTFETAKSYITDWEGRFHDVTTSYFDSFTETGTAGHNTMELLLGKDISQSIQELFTSPGGIQQKFGEYQANLIEYLGDSASLLIEAGSLEVGTMVGQPVGASIAGKFLADELKKYTAGNLGPKIYKRGEWVILKCGYSHQSKEKIRQEEWMSTEMFGDTFDAKDENLKPNYIIGFFVVRDENNKVTCFNFETLKTHSYNEAQVEKMPDLVKKSLDMNRKYSEARELWIMKDADVDPARYKFNIGAEVKFDGMVYNVIDRCYDGRILLEDRNHKRFKANPNEVSAYRDNYSAFMDDKQRFLSSGDFVWCTLPSKAMFNEPALCVISYFIEDKVDVFECMTGLEHVLEQRYTKRVTSKDYMLFCNIPAFAKFRKYAVQADTYLERFKVPIKYRYICSGLFDDHTVTPPTQDPNEYDVISKPTEKDVIYAGEFHQSVQAVNQELLYGGVDGVQEDSGERVTDNQWGSGYMLAGVVALFVVAYAVQN